MLTVLLLDNGEPSVIKMTYEDLYSELRFIKGSEIIVTKDWFKALSKVKNSYVCLVEADCLVSEKYFGRQMKEIKTNPGRKISMLTSKTAVKRWDDFFYGYYVDYEYTQSIIPSTNKKSNHAYPIEVGYVPGAIIRVSMLREAIEGLGINKSWQNDLVFLSSELSLAFWRQGANGESKKVQNGNPVYVNPNVTYVSTEDYINDIGKFNFDSSDLQDKFVKESI